MAALLRVDQLSKSYPKIHGSGSRLRLLYDALKRQAYRERHDVLVDISFDLQRGESLGIIGENGAGKSTLLKLIAGVLQPSSGFVHTQGKLAALLELGAGFHPDYSGLENIRMNAALSGLSSTALEQCLQHIIEFADIGDYIDEPIKHYSSGMVVRLGFAMITALQPNLLITDEVLAVGDESFQKKCITWMEGYLAAGGSLLLCSHGMYHIQKLCQKALWLEKGRCRAYGDAFSVTQAYLTYHESKQAKAHSPSYSLMNSTHTTETERQEMVLDCAVGYAVQQAHLYDENDQIVSEIEFGQTLKVRGQIFSPDGRSPVAGVGLNKINGLSIMGRTSAMDSATLKRLDAQHFEFCLTYPKLPLFAGEYIINCHAMDPEAMRLFDTYELRFQVKDANLRLGTLQIPAYWE